MSFPYNKYLEYLGHVDDTTRDDMLAREAKIYEQVEILKKQNQENLRNVEEQCELRLSKLNAALEKEKKSFLAEFTVKEAKYNAIIDSLKRDVQDEKTRGKKSLLKREAELRTIIDASKVENEQIKERFHAELKGKIAELEQQFHAKLLEKDGKIKLLKQELKEQKKVIENGEAAIRSHYDQLIVEQERKFHVKLLEKDGKIKLLKQELKEQKKVIENGEAAIRSYYEQLIFEQEQKIKARGFWIRIKDAFSSLFDKWASFFRAIRKRLRDNFFPGKNDFEENSFGAVGYIMALMGLVVCWLPSIVPLLSCSISFIVSMIGVWKRPRLRAIIGVVLNILEFFVFFMMWETVYYYW